MKSSESECSVVTSALPSLHQKGVRKRLGGTEQRKTGTDGDSVKEEINSEKN